MKPKLNSLVMVSIAVVAVGCYHEEFDHSSDYDMVVTIQDKDYIYSKNVTYAVVEEVADLSDKVSDPIEIEDREKWEPLILQAIHRNMKEAGYTEYVGEDITEADVVVAAGIVAVENWALYGYYPWWGWWGWYYYPPYVGAVDFSAGSVIMTMIDPDQVEELDSGLGTEAPDAGAGADGGMESGTYPAIWGAGIQGLLRYVTEAKVDSQIDQAFAQSPYLLRNVEPVAAKREEGVQ